MVAFAYVKKTGKDSFNSILRVESLGLGKMSQNLMHRDDIGQGHLPSSLRPDL
jgi:hypothetical protein